MIILALDPGQTTGIAVIDWPHKRQIKPREDVSQYIRLQCHIGGGKVLEEQISTIKRLIQEYEPAVVVFEKFLLYGNKAASQTGSDMYTSQVIGVIKQLCMDAGVSTVEQMAVSIKKFYTDVKLKEHGVYKEGMRHSRDATRHALYAIDFNLFKGCR